MSPLPRLHVMDGFRVEPVEIVASADLFMRRFTVLEIWCRSGSAGSSWTEQSS